MAGLADFWFFFFPPQIKKKKLFPEVLLQEIAWACLSFFFLEEPTFTVTFGFPSGLLQSHLPLLSVPVSAQTCPLWPHTPPCCCRFSHAQLLNTSPPSFRVRLKPSKSESGREICRKHSYFSCNNADVPAHRAPTVYLPGSVLGASSVRKRRGISCCQRDFVASWSLSQHKKAVPLKAEFFQ